MCSSNFSTVESFCRFCSIKISIAPLRSLLETDEIQDIDKYLHQGMARNTEIYQEKHLSMPEIKYLKIVIWFSANT